MVYGESEHLGMRIRGLRESWIVDVEVVISRIAREKHPMRPAANIGDDTMTGCKPLLQCIDIHTGFLALI